MTSVLTWDLINCKLYLFIYLQIKNSEQIYLHGENEQ